MDQWKWRHAMVDLVLRWLYLMMGAWLLAVRPNWISLVATVVGGALVLWCSARNDRTLLR